MSGWNPNSDLGEDGLPNMDKANYPFWVISLEDYLSYQKKRCATSSTDTDPDCNERKIVLGPEKGNYMLDVWRLNPPHGYVALGDYVVSFPSDQGSWPKDEDRRKLQYDLNSSYQKKFMLVFVKEKSGDPQNPYAKKCSTSQRIKAMLNPENEAESELNNAVSGSSLNGYDRFCNFGVNHLKYGTFKYNYIDGSYRGAGGNYNARVYMHRPDDIDGGNYVSLGMTFKVNSQLKWSKSSEEWEDVDPDKNETINPLENVWAVNKDLVINMRGSTINSDIVLREKWYWEGGRLLGDSADTGSGCNYRYYSISMIYNRKGVSLGSLAGKSSMTFLGLSDGAVQVQNNTNLYGDDWNKYLYNLKLYMLVPLSSKVACCNVTNAGENECGWGSFMISQEKPVCIDYFRDLCRSDNESYLTGDMCLTKMCKDSPSSSNPLTCDREYSKFCSIKSLDSNGKLQFMNYQKYPDICACFMPQDFLTSACNSMSESLGLRNNKAALKVLNIDTTDPDQCNQNCAVNPLCKNSLMVPSTTEYTRDRWNKKIQKGGLVDKSDCGDRTVCIQNAVINNEGKIGKLSISQEASCGTITDKVCGKSQFSLCKTHNGSGLFVKKLITDNDNGACGIVGEMVECAKFNITPIYDKCMNGKRIQVYNQLPITMNKGVVKAGVNFEKIYPDIDEDDALDALQILISPTLQNAYPSFCKPCRLGMIISDCTDCKLDFESSGTCYIDGNVWKQKFTKTKVIQQPSNGGLACSPSNEIITDSCSQDKNCKVVLKEDNQGCIDGVKSMKYSIVEMNSGNGMSCEEVVLNNLPKLFKDNIPSISIASDYMTATATIGCQDCIVGYSIDNSFNGGRCYWNGSSWAVKKIPVFLKEAELGGTCSQENIDLVRRGVAIYEKCKVDQDCSIVSNPIKDECDDKTGKRSLVFSIDKLENGKGMKCLDVGKVLAKKYNILDKDVSYNDAKKQLTMTGNCLLSGDCILSEKPVDSVSDLNQGITLDLYNIEKETISRGKTCDEVLKSKVNYDVFTIEQDGQLYVYKKGEISSNTNFYIIAGIALILVIIFIVIIVIRK